MNNRDDSSETDELQRQKSLTLSLPHDPTTVNDVRDTQLDTPAQNSSRYVFGPEIARGGVGIVHRATDQVLNREVAIKVLQERYSADSGTARRFEDEARIAAQLQHPAIPPIHDLGLLPDGRPFLAMKLIKGETLDHLLHHRGDIHSERPRYLAIFEQICFGLAYAHAHKVIHRDLKPLNIMVGAFGEVQVMDWGLAKVLQPITSGPEADPDETSSPTVVVSQRESDGSFTEAGSLLGTPAYIPPEQAIGALSRINERSDVFGLGAILAVILTGKPPFVGESKEAIRLMAAQADLSGCFERLDQCGADSELIAISKRCLCPKPEQRYANAGELARTISTYRTSVEERARQAELDKIRIAGESETALARADEQAKRRRSLSIAGTVFLTLVILGLTIGLAAVAQERDKTKAQKEAAENNAKLAFEAGDGAFEMVSMAEPYLASRPDLSDARIKALTAGAKAFREYMKQRPDDEALALRTTQLMRMTGNANRYNYRHDVAKEYYEDALTIAEKLPEAKKPKMLADLQREYSQSLQIQGNYVEAKKRIEVSREILTKLLATNPKDSNAIRALALCEFDYSGVLLRTGKSQEALAAIKQAQTGFQKIVVPIHQASLHPYDPLLYLRALTRMSQIYRQLDDYVNAAKVIDEAAEMCYLYTGMLNPSGTYTNEKGLPISKIVFQPSNFTGLNDADIYYTICMVRVEQAEVRLSGKLPNSKGPRAPLEYSVTMMNQISQRFPKTVLFSDGLAYTLRIRAKYLSSTEKPNEAKADLEKARAIMDQVVENHPALPEPRSLRGQVYWDLFKLTKSAEHLKIARAELKRASELAPENVLIKASREEADRE